MRTRHISLSVLALVLAALACGLPAKPTPTIAFVPVSSPSPAGATPGGPTAAAELTSTPAGPTATGPTPAAADLTTTPNGAATAAVPAGANLSNTGKSETPRLAFDTAGTLHLVWLDRSARETGDYFHRQKTANGDWSKAESLTTDFDILYADISLIPDQGGHMCAIFTAAKTSSDPTTIGLYQRCQAGDQWGAATKLAVTQQTGVTLRGYSPARGADGVVHAVFISGAGTINFDDVQLSAEGATALGPSLVIDKAGGYHAAWVNLGTATGPSTVQYRFSSDQGKTWQDAQTLSTDQNAPGGGVARLVADDSGNVHLLWSDGDIYYRRWTAAGGWGAPAALAGDQRGPNPAMVADAQGLARVVWERHDGLPYVVQAVDGTFSAPRFISHLESAEPQIVVDASGATHVAWLANKDVYYLARPDFQ